MKWGLIPGALSAIAGRELQKVGISPALSPIGATWRELSGIVTAGISAGTRDSARVERAGRQSETVQHNCEVDRREAPHDAS